MSKKICMIIGCEKRDDCWTNISFPDFVLKQRLRGYLGTQRQESSRLKGRKKNRMWLLRHSSSESLRQDSSSDKGFILRDARIYLKVEVRRVYCRKCGKVKTERIDFFANNPFYTKRFAYAVGRKCRVITIQDVAREYKLDWHTVKALDKEYMEEQLCRSLVAAPRVIGIDEVSLRKGHT